MSKNINVNPGQYKVAGRERQGEDVDQTRNKAARSQKAHELKQASRTRSKRGQKSGK